jgi:hypothetical protein
MQIPGRVWTRGDSKTNWHVQPCGIGGPVGYDVRKNNCVISRASPGVMASRVTLARLGQLFIGATICGNDAAAVSVKEAD